MITKEVGIDDNVGVVVDVNLYGICAENSSRIEGALNTFLDSVVEILEEEPRS